MPHAAAHCHWHDLQPRPLTTVRGRAFLYTEAARAAPTPKSARRRRCSAPHSACGRVRETSESARCVPRTRSAPPVTLAPYLFYTIHRQGFRGGATGHPRWRWFALVARDPGRPRELAVGFAAGTVDTDQTLADTAGFSLGFKFVARPTMRCAQDFISCCAVRLCCWLETQS